jgi:hypothetical protein
MPEISCVGTHRWRLSRECGDLLICVLFIDPFGKVRFFRVQALASRKEIANSGNRVHPATWKKDTAKLGSRNRFRSIRLLSVRVCGSMLFGFTDEQHTQPVLGDWNTRRGCVGWRNIAIALKIPGLTQEKPSANQSVNKSDHCNHDHKQEQSVEPVVSLFVRLASDCSRR